MEQAVLEAFKGLTDVKGKNVTVALSGGADSMALLNALNNLKNRLGITLDAAHLNHCIRGEEAERDQAFVEKHCKELGIKLHLKRVDVPQLAKKLKQSTELAARNARYDFFKEINTGFVATAHTASDNLETVLLNLTRGSSLGGLCGIPFKRDIFIRPLLLCTREQIEDYCQKNSVPFIIDSTNLSDDYTRNKIRHNVIPVLKEINPAVERAVIRTTRSLREDCDQFEQLAQDYISRNTISNQRLSLNGFEMLGKAVAKRVLKLFTEANVPQISLDNLHINELYNIALSGGRLSLPMNRQAVSVKNIFYISKLETTKISINLVKYQENEIKELKIVNNLFLNNAIDCDKIVGELNIRTRLAGDSIRLKNRSCTKTLNKLFNETAVALEQRDIIPVIADDEGIVWVSGFGVAKRCAVSDSTRQALLPQRQGEQEEEV